jgi:hypothetical protein
MATTDAEREGPETAAEDELRGVMAGARDTAGGIADGVAATAGTIAARLPEAAATTRAAVDEAARRIETGSDQMLTVGATFSLGLAIGLLIGGANRLLVAGALVPTAAMGMTLLDRRTATTQSRGSKS